MDVAVADILGVCGAAAITAAVWLLAGAPWALLTAGVLSVVAAVVVARGEAGS